MGRRKTIIEKSNPGYFVVATGKDPAYIWAVPGSHISIARTKAKHIFALSLASMADRVSIPPYSVFIARGDLQHAGAGSADYEDFTKNQARLHTLFFPASEQFPDAISLVDNFNPRFAGDSDSDSSGSEEAGEEGASEEDGSRDEESAQSGEDESEEDDKVSKTGAKVTNRKTSGEESSEGSGQDEPEAEEEEEEPERKKTVGRKRPPPKRMPSRRHQKRRT